VTGAPPARGYEDTTLTTMRSNLDRAPSATKLAARHVPLPSLVGPAATTMGASLELPTFQGITHPIWTYRACRPAETRLDPSPMPAGETPDAMRVLRAEGSRGPGDAGGGFDSLVERSRSRSAHM
jgi:hypothetical protein